MEIYYSSKFRRSYKNLPRHIKNTAEEKERIFRKDPFARQLQTHKLGGRFRGYWAFWVDQKYRVIFEFRKKDVIWFHTVGDHSIYRKD